MSHHPHASHQTVVQKGATILVSGVSGFIGAHVLDELLKAGYTVRGAVRSSEKGDELMKTRQQYKDKVSFVIVKDIGADGAFDEAVVGVDAVCHVASPFHMKAKDNEKDMLQPAVGGTTNMLKAAAKERRVKRVVITSSFAALNDAKKGNRVGHTYTEKDWNPVEWDEAVKSDNPGFVYAASKKFAEKAAWDFVEKEKPSFDVVSINPPMVYGPIVHPLKSLDELNESMSAFYKAVLNNKDGDIPPTRIHWFADVRDLALAHVRALEHDDAGGHRFVICNGRYNWQEVTEAIRTSIPDAPLPKPNPDYKDEETYKIDASFAEKRLGMQWRSIEETSLDIAKQIFELQKTLPNEQEK